MKRLLKILIAAALLWSAYWYAAGYGLRRGVTAWFAAQRDKGWQAEFADIGTTGYPLRHITTLTSPALADPATGAAWRADWLDMVSPAIWPGRMTLWFPPTPQRLSWFDRTAVIEAQDMAADLHLHPGVDLELDRMALTSGPWQISRDDGRMLGGSSLTVAMQQTDAPETYRYDIRAEGFAPGAGLRHLTAANASLPDRFEALSLDMDVTFDRVWDRRALEAGRPQPAAIDLRLARMKWGDLEVSVSGTLTVDASGVPTGALTVKAENWREMLAMVQSAGNLPQREVKTAERALNMLARMGRDPNALDVQLNLRDGFVAVGPFPLGPAPRLVLR